MAGELSGDAISDAVVILGAAGLVIPAFARAKISPVIGFILVGILVGPSGLGSLIDRVPWLYHVTITNRAGIQPIAEIGIVLLLFSIGLELSFKRLWGMRTDVFGIGGAQLLLSAAVIIVALRATGEPWAPALAVALALALSSTAMVLPITGMSGPLGRAAFPVLLLQDLALVPIVFVLGAMGSTGGGNADLLNVVLAGTATVVVMYLGGRIILPRLFAQAARTKSPELFLAAALLVAIVASLATAAAGLSPIVGALLAGLLIAETAYHDEVEVIVRPFQGLALGVFLITVGMSLDLALVAQRWPLLLGALAGVVAAKAIITAALLRWRRATWPVAAESGLLLASPGETTLIVLGVAVTAALISPAEAAFWQTATALGMTVTPLMARAGQTVARRLNRPAVPELDVGELGPGVVIVGFGRVGRLVAEMLQVHDKRFFAVDADVDNVAAGRRDGYPVVFGDVVRAELVERLALTRADALVLTMDDPALTVKLVKRVRAVDPEQTIIARARDGRHAAELYRAGVTEAVPETLESSLQLSEAVLVDLGVAMGPVIASIHEKRDELRRAVREAADLDREPRIHRVRGRSEGLV